MIMNKKIYCYIGITKAIKKKALCVDKNYYSFFTIINKVKMQLMIYLGRDDYDTCFEVKVIKSSPSDKYIPHECDPVSWFSEKDEYVSFYFDVFEYAVEFVNTFFERHKELSKRPMQKIMEVS